MTARDSFHVELVRLEVRCCCNPARIYGTLPIRASERHLGARIHLGAVERVAAGSLARVLEGTMAPTSTAYTVPLVVDRCTDLDRYPHPFLALKYADEELTPREKLRRLSMLPGFVPSDEALAQWP